MCFITLKTRVGLLVPSFEISFTPEYKDFPTPCNESHSHPDIEVIDGCLVPGRYRGDETGQGSTCVVLKCFSIGRGRRVSSTKIQNLDRHKFVFVKIIRNTSAFHSFVFSVSQVRGFMRVSGTCVCRFHTFHTKSDPPKSGIEVSTNF